MNTRIAAVGSGRLAATGASIGRPAATMRMTRIGGLRFAIVILVAGFGLAVSFYLAGFGLSRIIVAGGAGAFLAAAAVAWPRESLAGLVVWLAALGGLRRVLSLFTPRGVFDPLLGVAPIVWVVLVLVSLQLGAFRRQTSLSKAVFVMSFVTVISALNPGQQSLQAGITGLVVMLVPVLAFWVGKALADDQTLTGVFRIIAILAIPAAVYGFIQVFAGFPSWDETWIEEFGYTALKVRGAVIRPFSSFASGVEFGLFLAMGAIAWLSWRRGWLSRGGAIVIFVFLTTGIVYVGSRTVVVLFVAAIGTVEAARRRMSPVRGALIGMFSLAGVVLLAQNVSLDALTHLPGGDLIVHQLGGIGSPLDRDESTLLLHLEMVRDGLIVAFEHPIGMGPGGVTLAGGKVGLSAGSTEADVSNVAVALGLPGLAAYLVVLVIGYWSAYTVAAQRRDPLSLAVLGVLVLNTQQWLNGGHYLMAPLVWLCLGWLERTRLEMRMERRQRTLARQRSSQARIPPWQR